MPWLHLTASASQVLVEGGGETEAGDEPEVDAGPDARDAAPTSNDAGSTCVEQPPATGAVSNDCFAFGSCEWCGLPEGTEYLCSDSTGVGVGVHPNLAGCLSDNGGMSGWTSACCPSPPTCTRLASNDGYCVGQTLPGAAWACPVVGSKPRAMPTANGCLASGTTFSASGQPQEPSVPGAALPPASGSGLYCCQTDPGGDQ